MDAHGNGVPNCTVDQGHVQPRKHGDVVVPERPHDVGLVPARLVLHHSKYSTHVCMHGISRISHLKQGKFKLVQFLYRGVESFLGFCGTSENLIQSTFSVYDGSTFIL